MTTCQGSFPIPQHPFLPSGPSTHSPTLLSPLEVQPVVEFPLIFLQAESELSAHEAPVPRAQEKPTDPANPRCRAGAALRAVRTAMLELSSPKYVLLSFIIYSTPLF